MMNLYSRNCSFGLYYTHNFGKAFYKFIIIYSGLMVGYNPFWCHTMCFHNNHARTTSGSPPVMFYGFISIGAVIFNKE